MDFDWTEDDRQFRDQLQAYLKDELPPWYRGRYNEDDDAYAVTRHIASGMAVRGWLTRQWPKDYGGSDAPLWQQIVMREEMWVNWEPRGSQYMSTNWVGPSIMIYGTPEQKKEHLTRISEGRALWAQGFSEPDAGTDL